MTAVSVLRAVRDQGAVVILDGANLRLRASAPVPPVVLAAVRAEKAGLIHLLTTYPDLPDRLDDFEERAAILEFDAHLPRAEAERHAWAEVFGTANRPCSREGGGITAHVPSTSPGGQAR